MEKGSNEGSFPGGDLEVSLVFGVFFLEIWEGVADAGSYKMTSTSVGAEKDSKKKEQCR